MRVGSHLAAAVCESGVRGNIDVRVYSWAALPTLLLNDNNWIKVALSKNGSLKLKNISSAHRKEYCISLYIPQPFSRGRFYIWRTWKHRDKGAYLIYGISNDLTIMKLTLRKNGSLQVKHISQADRQQYCLSFDTPQPFSRGRLCIWLSWKHRYQDVFLHDHVNTASKWQDFS